MLIDVMGSKYVPPMASVMADDVPGEIKACLDLGCGSGSWFVNVQFANLEKNLIPV